MNSVACWRGRHHIKYRDCKYRFQNYKMVTPMNISIIPLSWQGILCVVRQVKNDAECQKSCIFYLETEHLETSNNPPYDPTCPEGSMISGYLLNLLSMMAFSVQSSSVGSALACHLSLSSALDRYSVLARSGRNWIRAVCRCSHQLENRVCLISWSKYPGGRINASIERRRRMVVVNI